jgi:xylulokinase
MIAFGTTGLLTVTDRPLVETAAGPHFSSVAGDTFAFQGPTITWGANVLSAGRLVRWYRDHLGARGRPGGDDYALLDAGAAQVPPGAEGLIVLPHLLGRRTPTPDATMRGAILGLNPSHTAAHIYRAVLESFAYNVRQGFGPLRSRIEGVVATAGGARSALWRQIMADVLDTPLAYHPRSSGALGIAFLAGYAVGLLDDLHRIKTEWLSGPEVIHPRPAACAVYNDLFRVYNEFDRVLAGPFAELAAVTEKGGTATA